MKFSLSIIFELILIKIDFLMDASKEIRKISVSFCYISYFGMPMLPSFDIRLKTC